MRELPEPKNCRHCEEDAVRRGNLLRASGCGYKRLLRFARNDELSNVEVFVTHHTGRNSAGWGCLIGKRTHLIRVGLFLACTVAWVAAGTGMAPRDSQTVTAAGCGGMQPASTW
jgi:hypothetical protein